MDHFAEKVTDAGVRAAADAVVKNGMRDPGYIYVNIDDSWEGDRTAEGVIQSNSRFPDMMALADYVHSRGLKLGIYSSRGKRLVPNLREALDANDKMRRPMQPGALIF